MCVMGSLYWFTRRGTAPTRAFRGADDFYCNIYIYTYAAIGIKAARE